MSIPDPPGHDFTGPGAWLHLQAASQAHYYATGNWFVSTSPERLAEEVFLLASNFMEQESAHELHVYAQGFLLVGMPNVVYSPLTTQHNQPCIFVFSLHPAIGEMWWRTVADEGINMTNTFPRMWLQDPVLRVWGTATSVPVIRPTTFCRYFVPPPPFTRNGAVKCLVPDCDQIGAQRCSRCHTAPYCSRECQKQDWRVHKSSCGK
jgi:hypothetical protein